MLTRRRAAAFIALPLLAAAVALPLWTHLGGDTPARANDFTVDVGDIWFCDSSFQGGVCDTTVPAGSKVTWDFSPSQANHTTTHCGDSCDTPTAKPLWDSGLVLGGSSGEAALFSYTFTEPGIYPYYCFLHPNLQRGRIIVLGDETPAAPTATRTATRTPTRTPTPPACETGDANMDGSVTSVDAALVLQFDAGLLNSLACPMGADVNGDGNVNSLDAALILQFVAGLLDEL